MTGNERRTRGSLSNDTIIDAATRFLEREGLAALSMPALARDLQSGTTSIYWYFRSRDELLVAVAERVTREIYSALPLPVGDDWYDEALQYFSRLRSEMLRRPVFLELISDRPRFFLSQPSVFTAISDSLERWMAALTELGVDAEAAARMFQACSGYTEGFVLREYGRKLEVNKTRRAGRNRPAAIPFDATMFPNLTSLADFDAAMALDEEHFDRGLRWMIEGIRSSVRG
jgi:AcrR family transcriptional regulator